MTEQLAMKKPAGELSISKSIGFVSFLTSNLDNETILQEILKLSENRISEFMEERIRLDMVIDQLKEGRAEISPSQELITTIRQLVEEKSLLTEKLTRLESLQHSHEMVLKDIVSHENPPIL